jgi:hypothetical protein
MTLQAFQLYDCIPTKKNQNQPAQGPMPHQITVATQDLTACISTQSSRSVEIKK